MRLVEEFAAVSQVASIEALHAAAQRFVGELEFERYELQLVSGGLNGEPEQWSTVGNVPEGYMPLWNASGLFCPVMQHAKKSSLPLYWGRPMYESENKMPRWESQTPWGYGTGFIVAAHLRRDKHVVVAVEREKPLRDHGARLTHKFALFQLFATCAIESIVSVLGQEEVPAPECQLSARELEVLRWTLAGKTAWEVGIILGISQGTAAQYVNRAARKLGVANKHQAAMKALRFGWIQ